MSHFQTTIYHGLGIMVHRVNKLIQLDTIFF